MGLLKFHVEISLSTIIAFQDIIRITINIHICIFIYTFLPVFLSFIICSIHTHLLYLVFVEVTISKP